MTVFTSLYDPLALKNLRNGQVGVIPTDTIYGLAAFAGNHQAVARLYELKSRDRKPGTLIAANVEQLIELGLDKTVLQAVAHWWPNPLSIIVLTSGDLTYLDQGLGDVATRVPADTQFLEFLQQTGPLLTSSANLPGQPPANNLSEAQAYFGDQVDFYVDGGDLSGRPPSTVARFEGGKLKILRQGAFVPR